MSTTDFTQLNLPRLIEQLLVESIELPIQTHQLYTLRKQWQQIQNIGLEVNEIIANKNDKSIFSNAIDKNSKIKTDIERLEVDWLITVFNAIYADLKVTLVRGADEPEYFPAVDETFARIAFAHGFFASALHEISHWCIAGKRRRSLPDFGYWYAPDGRTQSQQQAFEQVEIKPQAIECLLTLLCNKPFSVSLDNLHADFDTSSSTFAQDVFTQAKAYIHTPSTLPLDAKKLLTVLAVLCHDNRYRYDYCIH